MSLIQLIKLVLLAVHLLFSRLKDLVGVYVSRRPGMNCFDLSQSLVWIHRLNVVWWSPPIIPLWTSLPGSNLISWCKTENKEKNIVQIVYFTDFFTQNPLRGTQRISITIKIWWCDWNCTELKICKPIWTTINITHAWNRMCKCTVCTCICVFGGFFYITELFTFYE